MKNVVNERMKICIDCPLYKETKDGPICDPKKYMSPDGSDWSYFKKDGWKSGCGCHLNKRTANLSNHCNHGKW